ncbi:hypothetical protein J2755_000098 [Methanohalophilus levihalophilus]|nr:hypothetical protein [Methanohalophilus levihalophilus]
MAKVGNLHIEDDTVYTIGNYNISVFTTLFKKKQGLFK